MDNNQIEITIAERSWDATPEEAEALTELLDDMVTLTQADKFESIGRKFLANALRRQVLGPEPQESPDPRVVELETEIAHWEESDRELAAENAVLRQKLDAADTYVKGLEKDLDKANRKDHARLCYMKAANEVFGRFVKAKNERTAELEDALDKAHNDGLAGALDLESAEEHIQRLKTENTHWKACITELCGDIARLRKDAAEVRAVNNKLAEQLDRARRAAEALREHMGFSKGLVKFEWEL